jgi:hypothetical protein
MSNIDSYFVETMASANVKFYSNKKGKFCKPVGLKFVADETLVTGKFK